LQSLFERYGWALYIAFNVALLIFLVCGAAVGGGSLAELPYVMLFFAICSSAIPFISRLNGAFAMLGVIGAVYFLGFALADAISMLAPPKMPRPGIAFIDGGEAILLIGMLLQVIGFHLGVRITAARGVVKAPKDWPRPLLLPMGLLFWAAGAAATLYQSLVVQADNTSAAVNAGFSKLGVWYTSGLIFIENYAGPMGIVILAYWWTKWARRGSSTLILAIILIQFCVGWVVDQKETSLSGPLVILLTRFVIQGKVPMRWLICTVLGVVLVFPVLTAKRIIMTEGLGLTRAQALSHSGEILLRAIAERNVAHEGNKYEQRTQTFLERATDKAAVEVFAQHIGVDHPYKMGSTLDALLYAVIPRVVWSDKPGDNSAVTFNRDFHLSADPDTHISPTHMGELYWNFGLPGVVFGMALIGTLLGYICARFDPSVEPSLTGILVLIVTFYELIVRRGGQIEIEYVVWMRSILLIGILQLLFSRPVSQHTGRAPDQGNPLKPDTHGTESAPFPNLLR